MSQKSAKSDRWSLIDTDIYWGEFPEKQMDELLGRMRAGEYEKAKRYVEDELNRTSFIFGRSRSDFIYYLPLSKQAKVLDCGCGLGAHSFNLARYVKEVHGFDRSKKRVEFCRLRTQKEGVKNVHFFHSDFDQLPYKDNTFDAVIMNGLVEWLGERDRHKNPRDDQVEVLKVIHEKLRPGGILYIGIENRWAPAYLRGYDHSGLRWTNFMPRFLANEATKKYKGKPYRTYTYGRRGYKKLLHEAGFDPQNIDFYLAYPGYNEPRYIIPADEKGALAFFFRNRGTDQSTSIRAARFLIQTLGLWRAVPYLFYSYLIYAKK